MENRATALIDKGLKKGESLFILHGEYIRDVFLYDMYNGVLDMLKTMENFFLKEKNFDYFFYCKNSTFDSYKTEGSKIVCCTDTMFVGSRTEGDASEGMSLDFLKSSTPKQDNTQVEQAMESSNSSERNAFLNAFDYCKENPEKKIAFLFEDFDWTTGLHKSSNDELLTYIEKVKQIVSFKNCVVVITLEEAEMLKQYNFKIDGKNTILLGSAAKDEVMQVFLRRYVRTFGDKKLDTVSFKKLIDVSEAVASGEKSLMEAIRVFDRTMLEKDGQICVDDFEPALDKILEEKVYLDDVVLDQKKKDDIVRSVDEFLKAEKITNKTKGMILTGPPGTGKTFIVKAIANEKKCHFLCPSLADLKAEYVGQTGPKIKRIFQQARANAPAIIFIDEADTVFPSRSSNIDSDSFAKDMVNQFLVEMDGLTNGESKVFVVAATNRVNALDSAIRSRLGVSIDIPLPDKSQRRMLLEKALKKESNDAFDLSKYTFVEEYLDKTNRMSGRDIKNLVDRINKEAKKEKGSLRRFELDSDAKNKEQNVKNLFFRCLSMFEDEFTKRIQDELHISIQAPSDAPVFSDIIGYDNVKEAIDFQAKMFDYRYRNDVQKYGIKPQKGILLYGPPGNAKTQIALAAADEYKLYFMKVTSEAYTKPLANDQNRALTEIFDSALKLSEMTARYNGVLLFFDEFDALASQIDSRVRGTLLTHLDNENTMRNPESKVLFMAATNHIEKLDEASIRTGRIDVKLEMLNPSPADGISMIKSFMGRNTMVSEISDELTGMAYKSFVEATKKQKQKNYISVNQKYLLSIGKTAEEIRKLAEYDSMDWSPSGSDLKNYVAELIRLAFHQKSIQKSKIIITEGIVEKYASSICGQE